MKCTKMCNRNMKPLRLDSLHVCAHKKRNSQRDFSTTCIEFCSVLCFKQNWNIKHGEVESGERKREGKFIKMLTFLPEFQLKHHRPIFGTLCLVISFHFKSPMGIFGNWILMLFENVWSPSEWVNEWREKLFSALKWNFRSNICFSFEMNLISKSKESKLLES